MARNRTVWKEAIVVEGLSEFNRAIGKVAKDVAKQNRREYKRMAEHVASIARGKIERNVSGAAASSIKGMGSNAGASVRFPAGGRGSRNDPVGYYPWLDFGGGPVQGRGVTSHGNREAALFVRREVRREGRYVYPAIRESKDYIMDQAAELVESVARDERFETRGF